MKINEDYRVKLNVLKILKDSYVSFVKNEYKANPYVGRFGIGLKIKMPLSCEVRYYIFK